MAKIQAQPWPHTRSAPHEPHQMILVDNSMRPCAITPLLFTPAHTRLNDTKHVLHCAVLHWHCSTPPHLCSHLPTLTSITSIRSSTVLSSLNSSSQLWILYSCRMRPIILSSRLVSCIVLLMLMPPARSGMRGRLSFLLLGKVA